LKSPAGLQGIPQDKGSSILASIGLDLLHFVVLAMWGIVAPIYCIQLYLDESYLFSNDQKKHYVNCLCPVLQCITNWNPITEYVFVETLEKFPVDVHLG